MFPKAIVFDMDADRLAFFQESSELLKIHAMIWNEIRAMMIRVMMPMRRLLNATHAASGAMGERVSQDDRVERRRFTQIHMRIHGAPSDDSASLTTHI